ncbi:hypothetical protein QZH41_009511 [Actinostola sp. cb2023]|nr:hypothetical protein QZH41_009511 [Actinostola sp. cb2023]
MPEMQKNLEFQNFLDENQYTEKGILRYEKIFGRGFVSTGGLETTQEFVSLLHLKPGQKVLDVGCGIGGSAFYMYKNFDVEVLAVDLSTNMIRIGQKRAEEEHCTDKVKFGIVDITTAEYEPSSFDVIYSRDTILHIEDKATLFANFLKWLKPGGQLLISDYAHGEQEASDRYKAYIKQRNYKLLPLKAYGKIIEKVGFVDVKAEDKTEMFKDVIKRELQKTETIKDDFIKDLSQKDYDDIIRGWTDKLVRCEDGDQKWGLFYGVKQ